MSFGTAPTSPPASGTGEPKCVRADDRYFSNYPLVLTALSLVVLVLTRVASYLGSSQRPAVTSSFLTSPTGDPNLSKLESDVIISALGANLLPGADRLSPPDAEEVIREFTNDANSVKRWRAVKHWVRVVGSVVFAGVAIAAAVIEQEWKSLVFPVSPPCDVTHQIFLVLAAPWASVTPILTLHLVPALVMLRSAFIGKPSVMHVLPTVVELAYWAALVAIPYSSTLDRLLHGAHSKGGGSLGSYGTTLPDHVEEPTCE
jgi:hypothetical protein